MAARSLTVPPTASAAAARLRYLSDREPGTARTRDGLRVGAPARLRFPETPLFDPRSD